MTTATLLAPVAAALALLCFPSSVPVSAAPERSGRWGGASLSPPLRRAVTVGIAAAAVIVLSGRCSGWIALVVGGAAGASTLRLPLRHNFADRAVDRHRLAVHADLLAACLDAGMSVGSALQALAQPGPHREERPGSGTTTRRRGVPDPSDPLARLDAVAALLLLGADPGAAWQHAQEHPDLAALASAAGRTAAGGATFAEAVREHAVVLRAATADAAERSAGRAGVAITAPLGLCFLPAFLCLGLAPVVVGLLSSLHLF